LGLDASATIEGEVAETDHRQYKKIQYYFEGAPDVGITGKKKRNQPQAGKEGLTKGLPKGVIGRKPPALTVGVAKQRKKMWQGGRPPSLRGGGRPRNKGPLLARMQKGCSRGLTTPKKKKWWGANKKKKIAGT